MSDYLSSSWDSLKRIPKELPRNLADLAKTYGPAAAEAGAQMLPGAGLAQSWQDYGTAGEQLKQGNYGTAALNYLQGAYNQASDIVPGGAVLPTMTWAAAMVPGAKRGHTPGTKLVGPGGIEVTVPERAGAVSSGETSTYAKVKSPLPFEQMTSRTRPDPDNKIIPATEADLAKMVGGYGFPLVGDRTPTGQILTHINDEPLAWDVRLQGGPDYPRGGMGWASHADQITTLDNRYRAAQQMAGDKPVYGIYSGMGERSGDFSHMTADALLGRVPGANISGENAQAFDDILRSRLAADAAKKKGVEPAHWPGLGDVEASRAALLDRKGGDLRKAFVEIADTAKARSLGLPDVGSVRKAVTVPSLHDWSTGASGHSIVRFDPSGAPIRDPANSHYTYPSQYPGTYVGGTPVNLGRAEMFPQITASQFALPQHTGDPRSWAQVDRAFMTNAGLLEPLNNQWLDTVMTSIERRQREGR